MTSKRSRAVFAAVALAGAVAIAWAVYARLSSDDGEGRGGARGERPVPVEVVPIVESGPITLRRAFSGTLEAPARFVVAPEVGGRVERLLVDLGDRVERGQVVAELDDEAFVQEVAVAEAELAVAEANLTDAKNSAVTARRDLDRTRELHQRGIVSDAQLDAARAAHLSGSSRVEVARAQVKRAEAALAGARVRLGYTTITADWTGGDDTRVVGARYVDVGATVSAHADLLLIVELDPILGVFFVTEESYGHLSVDQPVTLTTDAYPGESFPGEVSRIAPIFQESSRQARIELSVANGERRLKPGMFVRASVVLDRVEDATIVPAEAVVRRKDRDGVFVVDEEAMVARWRPVTLGIREGDRIQVSGEGLRGRVITLGAQMAADGARVTIPDAPAEPPEADEVPGR